MRPRSSALLSREEIVGLCVALAAHGALIAALTLSPLGRAIEPPPRRMIVSFAPSLADQSTSPKPDAQPAPDLAPSLGEPDAADQPLPIAPLPKPAPKPLPEPRPAPKPAPLPAPKPVAKPKPVPVPKPKAEPAPPQKPQAKPAPKAKPELKTKPAPKPDAKPGGGDTHARAHPDKPAGGSRIDSNFLRGIAGVTSPGTDKVSPGDKPAPVSAATLVSAISRQIKPHWTAPQGADAEKLVTVLSWSLNPDGSLADGPVVVAQEGITDANRAQAQRHAELARRAVILAARDGFVLPPGAYAQWRRIKAFRFDRKLSQ